MAIEIASESGQQACFNFLTFMITGLVGEKTVGKKKPNASVGAEMLRHFLKLSYRRRNEIHDLLSKHRPGLWERLEKALTKLAFEQQSEMEAKGIVIA